MSTGVRLLTRLCLAATALIAASVATAQPTAQPAAQLTGDEAERFLSDARVVGKKAIEIGVTRPQRLTLELDGRTAHGTWKTVDIYRPVMDFRDGRPPEIGFRDSWKHEVAAYELDKLLGLELVPPTVERRIVGDRGSLQLWIEDAMMEMERIERDLHAPDVAEWNRQIHHVRLLRQLTHDIDFNNIGNMLVAPGFRIWAIDFSRAFKTRRSLLAAGDLVRFSRRTLDRLAELDAQVLEQTMGRWLTKSQRQALLVRRDVILERARQLVAEQGEEEVLLP